MTDLALKWTLDGGDLLIQNGDLVIDNTLTTPALLSLFSDKRCEPESLPDGETDPRGWWGDAYSEGGEPMGSLLWLLQRAKQTDISLADAQAYAAEAVAWMIRDKLLTSLIVEAEYPATGKLLIRLRMSGPKLKSAPGRTPYRVRRELNGINLHLIESATGAVLEIEA